MAAHSHTGGAEESERGGVLGGQGGTRRRGVPEVSIRKDPHMLPGKWGMRSCPGRIAAKRLFGDS